MYKTSINIANSVCHVTGGIGLMSVNYTIYSTHEDKIWKWGDRIIILFLYPDGAPGETQNSMGSKLEQDPSSNFLG